MEPGPQKARAVLKSDFVEEFAAGVVEEAFPRLASTMIRRSAILHWPERRPEIRRS